MAALPTVQDKTTAIPSTVNSYSDTTAPIADKSAGTLAEGIGSLFEEGTKAAYKGIKNVAEKALVKGYDEVNDRFGVSDAALQSRLGLPVKDAQLDTRDDGSSPHEEGTSDSTDFSSRGRDPGEGQELPVPADRSLNRIQRIQRANEAGKLSPSEYNAAMEAEVRRVRAEYPGFRDEIDSKMREITGITPANALRASMLRDQIALQRQGASSETFERNYRKLNDKYVAPGEEGLPFEQYRAKVVAAQQAEHQVTTASANLALQASKGTNVSSGAQQVATQALTGEADKVMAPLLAPLEKLVASKKGEPFSVTEIEKMRPQFAQVKLALDNSFEAYMDRPSDFDPAHPEYKGKGPTLRTLINDPNKVAALKVDYVGRIKAFETRLTDGNFGVMTFDKNSAESSVQAADAGLMRKEHMALLATVNQRFGPHVAEIVVGSTASGTPVLPLLQKTILDAGKLQLINKDGDDPSATKAKMQAAAAKPGSEPITASAYREQMKGIVQTMTNKDVPDEAKTEAVNKVVHDMKYIYTFRQGAGQSEAYATLSSPQVSDSVASLAVADPKIWQEYKGAAIKNFTGVYRDAAQDAQKVNKIEGWHTVFDPKANQFYATPDKGRGPIEDDQRRGNLDVYQGRLDELNRGLRSLSYILKKDGQEVGPQLLRIATAMGVDPKAPKEGFWDGLATAVGKTIKKADGDISSVFEPNIKD